LTKMTADWSKRSGTSNPTRSMPMYKVEYGYFNYPKKTREFKTYESAKKFFYYIGRQYGVKRVELLEA
jgi:hypothetical protein